MGRFKVAGKAGSEKARGLTKEMNTIKEKLPIPHWHSRKVPRGQAPPSKGSI